MARTECSHILVVARLRVSLRGLGFRQGGNSYPCATSCRVRVQRGNRELPGPSKFRVVPISAKNADEARLLDFLRLISPRKIIHYGTRSCAKSSQSTDGSRLSAAGLISSAAPFTHLCSKIQYEHMDAAADSSLTAAGTATENLILPRKEELTW